MHLVITTQYISQLNALWKCISCTFGPIEEMQFQNAKLFYGAHHVGTMFSLRLVAFTVIQNECSEILSEFVDPMFDLLLVLVHFSFYWQHTYTDTSTETYTHKLFSADNCDADLLFSPFIRSNINDSFISLHNDGIIQEENLAVYFTLDKHAQRSVKFD